MEVQLFAIKQLAKDAKQDLVCPCKHFSVPEKFTSVQLLTLQMLRTCRHYY